MLLEMLLTKNVNQKIKWKLQGCKTKQSELRTQRKAQRSRRADTVELGGRGTGGGAIGGCGSRNWTQVLKRPRKDYPR